MTARPTATHSDALIESTNAVRASDAISVPFAPSLPLAIGLLLARFAISQMDVPARQAFVVSVVGGHERTAAAAYTNTARYVSRPAGPFAAGALMRVALGAPFVVAGVLKSLYDVLVFARFRRVPLPEEPRAPDP